MTLRGLFVMSAQTDHKGCQHSTGKLAWRSKDVRPTIESRQPHVSGNEAKQELPKGMSDVATKSNERKSPHLNVTILRVYIPELQQSFDSLSSCLADANQDATCERHLSFSCSSDSPQPCFRLLQQRTLLNACSVYV